jgi:predicted small secreted protein
MILLRRSVLLVLLVASAIGLAACENTIRGFGRDVRETGDAVGDAMAGR